MHESAMQVSELLFNPKVDSDFGQDQIRSNLKLFQASCRHMKLIVPNMIVYQLLIY